MSRPMYTDMTEPLPPIPEGFVSVELLLRERAMYDMVCLENAAQRDEIERLTAEIEQLIAHIERLKLILPWLLL